MQRGPTTFYLRVISQKGDNLRTPSNKIMYKTTDSQNLKLKNGKICECVIEIISLRNSKQQFVTNIY